MKNKLRIIIPAALACAALLLNTGCMSVTKKIGEVKETLDAFDRLGLTEVDVPGRATTTRYRRVEKDGKTVSTLTHNNPYMSEPIRIVRERPTVETPPAATGTSN